MEYTKDLAYMRNAYAPGVSEQDFFRFVEEAGAADLDPRLKEMWAIPGYGTEKDGTPKPAIIMPSILGYRKMGDRSGLVEYVEGPEFMNAKGEWFPVWIFDVPPSAARFRIKRKDQSRPVEAIVTWRQRVKTWPNGEPMNKWASTPAEMLGINAERDCWKRSGLCHSSERATYDPDDYVKAMQRAHQVASLAGIDHSQLRRIALDEYPELTSLSQLNAQQLHDAADLIAEVGAAAVPADPETGEMDPLAVEHDEFVQRIEAAIAKGAKGADDWGQLIALARQEPVRWGLLIRHSPTLPYAERLRGLAVQNGVREKDADMYLGEFRVRFEQAEAAAREADHRVAETQAAPVTKNPDPAAPTWDEFWKWMHNEGYAQTDYETYVGREPTSFEDPVEAFKTLKDAIADLEGLANMESENDDATMEAEFRDVQEDQADVANEADASAAE